MPSITKRKSAKGVRYLAEASIEHVRGGKREYKTFSTQLEALKWATAREQAGIGGMVAGRTVADLFDRYAREVSSTKAGERWEVIRLKLISKSLGTLPLERLAAPQIAAWRDARLRQVSAASVRREMNLIGHAFSVAVKEWHWLEKNPVAEVSRPASSPPRERTYSEDEIARIMLSAGTDVGTATGRVGLAFRFALETGMRAGEICGLTWDRVFASHVRVQTGKTDAARRDVPLSKNAVEILNSVKPYSSETVFALTSAQLDALFRKIAKRAMVDATFHDCRHSAATRIVQRTVAGQSSMDTLSLCKMFGWRDVRMALLYFNPSAADLAAKLG